MIRKPWLRIRSYLKSGILVHVNGVSILSLEPVTILCNWFYVTLSFDFNLFVFLFFGFDFMHDSCVSHYFFIFYFLSLILWLKSEIPSYQCQLNNERFVWDHFFFWLSCYRQVLVKLPRGGLWSWDLSFCHGNQNWSLQEPLLWASTLRLENFAVMW